MKSPTRSKVPDPLQVMKTFTLSTIPNLDVCVLAALDLFSQQEVPTTTVPYRRPLVVGNAAATGRILFEKSDAVFADESTVDVKLQNIQAIDGVVLISASGGKHAPVIAQKAKKAGKKVTLLTNNENAPARPLADTTYVFPKNREPYTYNTSTYMGMILGQTPEDPKEIKEFIQKRIDPLEMPDLAAFDKFFFVVPEEFGGIIRLLNVKFIELFGRNVARDIETFEYMKHAVTVVPSNELFVSFGRVYNDFGNNHLTVPLPKQAGYAAMMAIGYYIIGKIQKAHPDWFKQNIENYCRQMSKVFSQTISPIVE